MANIGAIVGEGFGLLKRRPSAVLCWGAIHAVGSVALAYAQLRLVGVPDPATMSGANIGSGLASGLAVQILFGLLSMTLSTILSAAAFRAVLWPDDRGIASIRLGMDEARLIGLTLILYVLALVGGLVSGLGVMFMTTLTGLLFGGNPAVAGSVVTLILSGLMCLILFLLVRLSVVYPLVLVRRRISIDAGWELTRGHFWSLLGAYILIGLATVATLALSLLPLMAVGISANGHLGSNWLGMIQQLQGTATGATPLLVVAMLAIGSLVSGFVLAMWSGGVARATPDLLSRATPEPDVAQGNGAVLAD